MFLESDSLISTDLGLLIASLFLLPYGIPRLFLPEDIICLPLFVLSDLLSSKYERTRVCIPRTNGSESIRHVDDVRRDNDHT